MAVSLWAVLGIVLLILGLPFLFLLFYLSPSGVVDLGFMTGLFVGAGAAFLIVAAARSGLDSSGPLPTDDADLAPP